MQETRFILFVCPFWGAAERRAEQRERNRCGPDRRSRTDVPARTRENNNNNDNKLLFARDERPTRGCDPRREIAYAQEESRGLTNRIRTQLYLFIFIFASPARARSPGHCNGI